MKRRIVQHGLSTLTVSLPSTWVKKLNLKKGDEIEINEMNELLTISPVFKTSTKDLYLLDLTKYPSINERLLRIVLTHIYRKGYQKFKIKYKHKKDLDLIEKTVRERLLGVEILNIKDNDCIVECFTEPEKNKFNSILNRVFYINNEALNLICDDINKSSYLNFKRITNYSLDINKYTNYIRRLIKNEVIAKQDSIDMLWSITQNLLLISHCYKRLYNLLAKNNIKLSNQTSLLFKEIVKLNHMNQELYQHPDYSKFDKGQNFYNKLLDIELPNLLSKSKGDENLVLFRMGKLIRYIGINNVYCYSLSL